MLFQPPMAANVRVPGYVECFVKCLAMLFKCYTHMVC